MGKTILANVDGFTPIIDSLAQELGLITAAVFGRVWRYCQGEQGVCTASMERIAQELGLGRATVMRHIHILVENGYLKDLTPDLVKRSHTYADTGKAGLSINIGVSQRNTASDRVSQRNSRVSQRNTRVSESNTKKEEDTSKKVSPAEKTTTIFLLSRELAEVCGMDFQANKGRLLREAKQLTAAACPPAAGDLRAHYQAPDAWWWKHDWRGKKGQRPTPAAIRETWGAWDKEAPGTTISQSSIPAAIWR